MESFKTEFEHKSTLALLEVLKERLPDNPLYISQMFEMIGKNWNDYLTKEKQSRDIVAYQALSDATAMITNKEYKTKKYIPFWVDIVVYLCPEGLKGNGHSVHTRDLLAWFCPIYFNKKNDFYESHWEREIKGYGKYMDMLYAQWMEKQNVQ